MKSGPVWKLAIGCVAFGAMMIFLGIQFYRGTPYARRSFNLPLFLFKNEIYIMIPLGISFLIVGIGALLAGTVFGAPIALLGIFAIGAPTIFSIFFFMIFGTPKCLKPKWVREQEEEEQKRRDEQPNPS